MGTKYKLNYRSFIVFELFHHITFTFSYFTSPKNKEGKSKTKRKKERKKEQEQGEDRNFLNTS